MRRHLLAMPTTRQSRAPTPAAAGSRRQPFWCGHLRLTDPAALPIRCHQPPRPVSSSRFISPQLNKKAAACQLGSPFLRPFQFRCRFVPAAHETRARATLRSHVQCLSPRKSQHTTEVSDSPSGNAHETLASSTKTQRQTDGGRVSFSVLRGTTNTKHATSTTIGTGRVSFSE